MTDQLTNQPADSKKQSITYGIYLGVIALVLGIITMYISKSTTSLVVLYGISAVLNLVVFIGVTVFFSINLRKGYGGYWSFSQALKSIFIMLAFATLISSVGSFLFTKYIEPTIQEEVMNNTSSLTIEMMENSGANDDQIDEVIAKLDEAKASISNISFSQFFKGFGITLISYFVLALILAAIFKREKPVFLQGTRDSNDTYGNLPNQQFPNQ